MKAWIAMATLAVLLGFGSLLVPAQSNRIAQEESPTVDVGPPPWSKGKGIGPRPCIRDCPPCTVLVDLTPQNPVDCRYECVPDPRCDP